MKSISRISTNSMTKINQKEQLLSDVDRSINPNLKMGREHHCLRMKRISMRNKRCSKMMKLICRISRNSRTKIYQKEQLLLGVDRAINPTGMKKILIRRSSRQITSSPPKTTLDSFKDSWTAFNKFLKGKSTHWSQLLANRKTHLNLKSKSWLTRLNWRKTKSCRLLMNLRSCKENTNSKKQRKTMQNGTISVERFIGGSLWKILRDWVQQRKTHK